MHEGVEPVEEEAWFHFSLMIFFFGGVPRRFERAETPPTHPPALSAGTSTRHDRNLRPRGKERKHVNIQEEEEEEVEEKEETVKEEKV